MKENSKIQNIYKRDLSIHDIMGPQDSSNKINVKE